MSIPITSAFIPNPTLRNTSLFPIPVRLSSHQRLKRHTSQFAFVTTAFSLSYHLLALNFKFAIKQAAISFLHKGSIAFLFFYTNQVIWGYLQGRKQQRQDIKSSRIPAWASLGLTSTILFPIFFALNRFYKLSPKKTVMRSIVDTLLLLAFGLEFERGIRQNRNILLTGTQKQKRRIIEMVK